MQLLYIIKEKSKEAKKIAREGKAPPLPWLWEYI